jgi:hypothetical protein
MALRFDRENIAEGCLGGRVEVDLSDGGYDFMACRGRANEKEMMSDWIRLEDFYERNGGMCSTDRLHPRRRSGWPRKRWW